MIWFWLSAGCSAINFALFKWFDQLGIRTFQAIVANYFVCILLGIFLAPTHEITNILGELPIAMVIGLMYILLFWLIGRASQRIGIAATVTAAKVSMILPVLFGLYFFGESGSLYKTLAIVLAFPAVILSSLRKSQVSFRIQSYWLPLTIFLGSGCADILLAYTQKNLLQSNQQAAFLVLLFGTSAAIGAIALGYAHHKRIDKIHPISLAAGIVLGLFNFVSVYALMQALKSIQSSTLFPLNNLTTILLSTSLAVFVFKEKLEKLQILGIIIALTSLILLLHF
jgi:drug/metabolite transporter (DMT)-like permease